MIQNQREFLEEIDFEVLGAEIFRKINLLRQLALDSKSENKQSRREVANLANLSARYPRWEGLYSAKLDGAITQLFNPRSWLTAPDLFAQSLTINLIDVTPIERAAWITTAEIVRYQESKRGCCEPTFSPVSPPICNEPRGNNNRQAIKPPIEECCGLRKYNYAKSQAEADFCNTQRLLEKIRYLKRNVQDLEYAQQRIRTQQIAEKKETTCQTLAPSRSDVNNFREILDNCIKEMTRLRGFFEDENVWWKIFKKREFNCCEQKLPHLHGYLDGTMVTLKILEEKKEEFGEPVATSTPTKSPSSPNSSNHTRNYREEREERVENHSKTHANSSTNTETISNSCQNQCPASCQIHEGNLDSSRAETQEETVDQTQRNSEQPRTISYDETSDTENTNDTYDWFSKNNVGNAERPSITFNSENTAKRATIAADISTSIDLIPYAQYRNIRPSIKTLRDVQERNFSIRESKVKKQIRQANRTGQRYA
ncbi:hypothetical protein K0M31_003995 [Melipona bicolor]|uniref:Uncharacterized protein n=1 Tax=Melipona bicolor TaxID=60889 RepID=A0AA40FXZ3_9HYME|nr:hypothetical protein K0M31_003995 [Melipona bicolor]